MPAFFWPVVIFPFVFSKLAFFQVLIGLTFPAYLILAWREKEYRPRLTMLYIAIVAYFIAVGLSVAFSVDPVRSWWGNQERMNGLFTLLHFFAWLTMAIGMLKTWPQWKKLLNFQVGLSGFMALVAILQKPFPRLLTFEAGERVGGLLDNPIYMGAYQIFSLFFLALLWLKEPRKGMKVFYAIIAALDIGAFILAQSRGALLGLGIGIVVFAISYAAMTPNKKVRMGLLSFLLIGFAGYGLLFATKDTEFVRSTPLARFTNFQAASETRLIAWDIAWRGFLDKPITGWGFDSFHILFNEKYNPQSLRFGYYETWFDRAHNTIMDVMSMTGALGFVTFAAIYVTLFTTVIRGYRKKWIDAPIASILLGLPVGYFVQNLFVFDHPAAFSMSYLLFAFVISIDSKEFGMQKADEADVAPEKQGLTGAMLAAFAVLELAAIFVVWKGTVRPFQASMLTIRSNNAFAQGEYEEAFTYAQEAATISTPYIDEQTFLQSRNFMRVANAGQAQNVPNWEEWYDLIVGISREQIEAHPKNAHPRFIFARFGDTTAGLKEESVQIADEEYKEAIALSPKRQQLFYSYARYLIRQQRFEEAESVMREVISFDEEIGEGHWILGLMLLFDLGNIEEGPQEIARSQETIEPYALRDAREVLALAFAYDALGTAEKMKGLLPMLSTLPRTDMAIYLDIARLMEKNGLLEERDAIVGAVANIDQDLAKKLAPLMGGTVETIDESLNLTTATAVEVATGTESGGETSSGPRK